jgi:radical SAM superfamily enzyme YgiQ (UPF0313 family)
VRRIQKRGINVAGSFIIGIDTDEPGIGEITARAAEEYSVDGANIMILTPLPGTALYKRMEQEGRIVANNYPEDWQYYTLCYPVAKYKNFTWSELLQEVNRFSDLFSSYPKILYRILRMVFRRWKDPRAVAVGVVGNLSYRYNDLRDRRLNAKRGSAEPATEVQAPPPPVDSTSLSDGRVLS